MSLETMTKLATYTVGSGGIAAVDFTNIPQNYTDLKVVYSTRTSNANIFGYSYVYFNGSQTGYSQRVLEGGGGSAAAYAQVGTYAFNDDSVGNSATSNVFGNSELVISNYSGSGYKSFSVDGANENSATTAYIQMASGIWSNSAPITRITFSTSATSLSGGSPTYLQYSTFTLYGIKNAARTAGNSIKATGGIVAFDGTYVSHTFVATDTFRPTQVLNAEYVVVAGGGGGGTASDRSSGAGGAGGYRSSVAGELSGGGASAESKITLQPTSYAVVIGAGGSSASAGSSSVFGSITSVGGGSGSTGPVAASIGGSGGGGSGGGNYSNGVAGTSGQGYAGGNGYNSGNGNTNFGGGGGGGAGAKGNDATGDLLTTAGNGGIGVLSYILGVPAYYAGGGGGGSQANSGASSYAAGTGGLGGGGNGGKSGSSGAVNGSNGTANTGGGGGGAVNAGSGGTGGSGVVIIRYKG